MIDKKNYNILYLLTFFKKYILSVSFFDNLKIILKNSTDLPVVLQSLHLHSSFRFDVLVDIICVDHLVSKKRFEIIYSLLSIKYNCRILLSIFVEDCVSIPSVTNIYSGANWFEREIWDMYGIVFSGHPDLRRILTDYGFDGYPFRKDFPLNGYIEIRYDENKQYLIYEPIELMQNMRFYDFVNPFMKNYII
jgi:NADH/F420H2 dehydrogenase subunit C